jgi:hypothetical protein
LRVAATYLEVAELIDVEDGAAVNVCVGVAVLAGIAAGDAICAASLGTRHAGADHRSAADLLRRVDGALARQLTELVEVEARSHYGAKLLTPRDRARALRCARALVTAAKRRYV